GLDAGAMNQAANALELGAFRAPYFGKGLEGLVAALEAAQARSWRHAAVRRLGTADWDGARALLQRFTSVFKTVNEAFASSKPASVQTLARQHFQAAQALARTNDQDDGSSLRQGEAGEWAVKFFAGLIDEGAPALEITASEYPEFYRTMVAGKRIRLQRAAHPRVAITDPFDARLQHADVVILGGLNEGTW